MGFRLWVVVAGYVEVREWRVGSDPTRWSCRRCYGPNVPYMKQFWVGECAEMAIAAQRLVVHPPF